MGRIMLDLEMREIHALAALARRDSRDTRDELRYLVRMALEATGAFDLAEADRVRKQAGREEVGDGVAS